MKKYKYQRVLKVGNSSYDNAYSRLYIKLPVKWCKENGIQKSSWLLITEENGKLIIEEGKDVE